LNLPYPQLARPAGQRCSWLDLGTRRTAIEVVA
jgi:hypothetical protein